MGVGPRHDDLARLERRAQGIQRLRRIFRELVQKEHAIVREGGFARPGAQAATGQRGHGGGVMRRTERPVAGQAAAFDQPGHRPDHGGFQ